MITMLILSIVVPFILVTIFPPAICRGERDYLIKGVRQVKRNKRMITARRDAHHYFKDQKFVLMRDIENLADSICDGDVCYTTWKPNKQ